MKQDEIATLVKYRLEQAQASIVKASSFAEAVQKYIHSL